MAKDLAMSDRWVSVEEIADYLGVSQDTAYGWIAKRDMPAHRVGRLWKLKTVEVDNWVRRGKASDDQEGSEAIEDDPKKGKNAGGKTKGS